MRFRYHAIAVLSALLVMVPPAIAQPKPSPVPQTSPSLNLQQQQELQQFKEEKRLQELIKKDLEENKAIGDRVQAEVDRAFSHTTTLLNVLLVVLTLFPILTVLGAVGMRHSIRSAFLTEIKKSGEETKRELADQVNVSKQEIEQIASEAKTQLKGMVLEAEQVLTALREQTALAQTELESLSTEAKSNFQKAASDLQQQQERASQLSQQLSSLFPASRQEPIAAENLPKVQAITTELVALQSANPELILTANDYLNQGNAFLYEARYEEAISAYDKAFKLKPDDWVLWNNQGIVLGKLHKYADALGAYDEALEFNPDSEEIWNNRGWALYNLQRYDDALLSYEKALELKPDNYEVLSNRGLAFNALQKYADAITSYDKALEFKPDGYQAWCNRGITLKNLQQYDAALASQDKALKLKPDLDIAWYSKARCYGLQGKTELTVEHLREAIRLNSDCREQAKTDSDFAAIREDERFQQLIEG